MYRNNRLKLLYELIKSKKGDEAPGWIYIISLILGLILIIVVVYLAYKAGQKQTSLIEGI